MQRRRQILATVTTLIFLVVFVVSFKSQHLPSRHRNSRNHPTSSRLFGVQEWRDNTLSNQEKAWSPSCSQISCNLPIHIIDSSKVALQGETVYLQFTRDDEVRLFQQAVDHHEGIFGLGYLSSQEEILYDRISLVELKDYNMVGDRFGIFLSVQVVGTAMIWDSHVHPASSNDADLALDIHVDKQPLVARCTEMTNRDEQLTLAQASEIGRAVETLIAEVCRVEKESRVFVAESEDRWDRYREAYHQAYDSDCQGYTYSEQERQEKTSEGNDEKQADLYTWKELNAISWAAFSTSAHLPTDESYRLAALDNDYLSNRLLLATYWLSDVLEDVKERAI